MQFISVFLSLVGLASTAFAEGFTRCGAEEPSQWLLDTTRSFSQKVVERPEMEQELFAQAVTVPTYFHVIMSGSSESQGNIPDSKLYNQIDVLNEHYAAAGISFNLQGITRTTNSNWFNDGDEMGMKAQLHRGDYGTLNVYFLKLAQSQLGYCYFPQANPSSTILTRDGCTVLFSSVPGGATANYNQGKTLTHEVGHYMGLYHTFQGGCSTTNDGVSDTPAERSPASGCPVGRDTCTGSRYPGVDPIHNFMDYSYDSCMDEFSPNQLTRMNQFWNNYRA